MLFIIDYTGIFFYHPHSTSAGEWHSCLKPVRLNKFCFFHEQLNQQFLPGAKESTEPDFRQNVHSKHLPQVQHPHALL